VVPQAERAAVDPGRRKEAHARVVQVTGRSEYARGDEALKRNDPQGALEWFRKAQRLRSTRNSWRWPRKTGPTWSTTCRG
jgi:hypothetical protein